MKILDHKWGESDAADRFWAHYAGMRPSLVGARHLMVYQAYIDDSVTEGGMFVLGGAVASVEQWAEFNAEWEPMVAAHGIIRRDGSRYFKMSEMALSEDRMSKVPWFYAILERHAQGFLSYSFDMSELHEAQQRISSPGLNLIWDKFGSPYILAFRGILDMFHSVDRLAFEQMGLPSDAVVDFWFDDRSEKKQVRDLWDTYIELWPSEIKSRFGKEPRFESDDEFPPLQGADLWAWWARRFEESSEDSRQQPPRTGINSGDKPKWLAMSHNQDQLVKIMAGLVHNRHPDKQVFDTKTGELIFG